MNGSTEHHRIDRKVVRSADAIDPCKDADHLAHHTDRSSSRSRFRADHDMLAIDMKWVDKRAIAREFELLSAIALKVPASPFKHGMVHGAGDGHLLSKSDRNK